MPETRLQSDMIQNMGRSAAAAMFQRNQILANQQEWLDYVQARDGGAFQPSYGGGYLHEEYLPGERQQANTYLKYYQQQQAKQLAFQRARFLNAQRFQNAYMLQQQRAQDLQIKEERAAERTKQEMDRKLAVVNRELDALENNQEIDKNSWEYKNRRQQLLDDRYELETDLERNTLMVHEEDSGFKDASGNPINSRFMVGPDGKPVYISEGKDVAANQLARDALDQKTRNDSAKLNLDREEFEFQQKQHKDMLPIKRAEVTNSRVRNELTAAGQSQDDSKSRFKIADELEDRNARKRDAQKAQIEREWEEEVLMAGDDDQAITAATQRRNDRLDALDFGPATPTSPHGEYRSHRPTGAETRDEIERRNILNDPDATPADLQKQVQYEGPMDPGMEPEFSDEQFAGTEPAGLYDPTGQPFPMDGGMYNGLA